MDGATMPVRLDPAMAMMLGTRVLVATLAAQQAAHEKDCTADRERTRQSFDELRHAQEESERRIAMRQNEMHTDHNKRFDAIESLEWKVVGGMIVTFLAVIGFGLAHIIGHLF